MAPVIRAFRAAPWARCRVLLTAQHRDLVDPMLAFFGIEPDIDLDIMRPDQSLVDLTSRMLPAVHDAIGRERPDIVLAQGDTTTVFVTALASFYRRVPFGHVEAGLRTGRLDAPFPEEANRVLAGHLSALHFAPTAGARDNLLREGIADDRIVVTGNTVIDALLLAAARDVPIGVDLDPSKRLVLVTAHRRDSFGEPIRQICRAVAELHERFPDVQFLWPVHPNPSIKPVVERAMSGLSAGAIVRPPGLRPVRLGPEAIHADPDRLGRRAGRGPGAGEAGAGPARGERATRGDRGRASPGWSATTRPRSSREASRLLGDRGCLPRHGPRRQPLRRRPRRRADRRRRRAIPRYRGGPQGGRMTGRRRRPDCRVARDSRKMKRGVGRPGRTRHGSTTETAASGNRESATSIGDDSSRRWSSRGRASPISSRS